MQKNNHSSLKKTAYPNSFPDPQERRFLQLLLCDDSEFMERWDNWKKSTVFDDIDYAQLRLLPVLYLRLQKRQLPDDGIIGRIKGAYKMSWVKNQLLVNATEQLSGLLGQQNISVLLLKGIPLLAYYYKDFGARFLSDADLMVREESAEKAIKLIVENRWTYINPDFTLSEKLSFDQLKKTTKETGFKNALDAEADLHWDLSDPYMPKGHKPRVSFAKEIWSRAVTRPFKGTVCSVPCPEDMLIHVIVHGATKNDCRPIRWVVDAMTIIRTSPVNWAQVMETTKKCGFHVEIYVGISYLIEHHGLETPESFARELSALELTRGAVNRYYAITNTSLYSAFGNFPQLVRSYRHEANGDGLLKYLSRKWGLERRRDVPGFIFNKYSKRFSVWIEKIRFAIRSDVLPK